MSPVAAPAATVKVIAKGLHTDATQRVTLRDRFYIVPNLDGELLKVAPNGKVQSLVNLKDLNYGIPFGVTTDRAQVIATVSSYDLRHALVGVNRQGKVTAIADLSDRCGELGAPFGITMQGENYVVSLSPNTTESLGLLLQVTPQGAITSLAELDYGIPLSVVLSQNSLITAHSKGPLVQTDRVTGKSQLLQNLVEAGVGNPLGLATDAQGVVVSTSDGWLVQVSPQGELTKLINIRDQHYGLPAGIAVEAEDLIVTTNSGYLLRVILPKA